LLQSVEYHTSCSQPIQLGDIIGNATLVGYVGEDGSLQSPPNGAERDLVFADLSLDENDFVERTESTVLNIFDHDESPELPATPAWIQPSHGANFGANFGSTASQQLIALSRQREAADEGGDNEALRTQSPGADLVFAQPDTWWQSL
jgi:hypothetical protein